MRRGHKMSSTPPLFVVEPELRTIEIVRLCKLFQLVLLYEECDARRVVEYYWNGMFGVWMVPVYIRHHNGSAPAFIYHPCSRFEFSEGDHY